MPDQPLALQLREHAERLGGRTRLGAVEAPDAQPPPCIGSPCPSGAWRMRTAVIEALRSIAAELRLIRELLEHGGPRART